MKIKFAVVAACVALAACGGGQRPLTPTKTVYKIVRPEAAYFTCEKVQLPNPDTLTDVQIAALINDLVKANRTCSNNMNAIKQYLDAAEQIVEDRNEQ